MIAIVCIDDQAGLMFNHRRQSKDRILLEKVLLITKGNRLFVSPYTAKQFSAEEQKKFFVAEACFTQAGPGDYCFAEDLPVNISDSNLESIVVFRWNRIYPADTFFDLSALETNWNKCLIEDFAGNSHKKITMEVYTR